MEYDPDPQTPTLLVGTPPCLAPVAHPCAAGDGARPRVANATIPTTDGTRGFVGLLALAHSLELRSSNRLYPIEESFDSG